MVERRVRKGTECMQDEGQEEKVSDAGEKI